MGAENSYEFECRGDSWIALGGQDEVNRFRNEWERLNSLEREKAREILRIQRKYEESKREMEKAGFSYREKLEQLKIQHERDLRAKVDELKNNYEMRLRKEQEKNARQAEEHEAVVEGLKQMHTEEITDAVYEQTAKLESKLEEMESRFDKTDASLTAILAFLNAGKGGKEGNDTSTRMGSLSSSTSSLEEGIK
jgi:chromosome segregation ATPase